MGGSVIAYRQRRRSRRRLWPRHLRRGAIEWFGLFIIALVVLTQSGVISLDDPLSGIFPADAAETVSRRFGLCGQPPHLDCVIDGDTFYLADQSIRISDIDTPETNPPRCAEEARLGEAATHQLRSLLNAGPFELRAGMRDDDRYGRKLRTVVRNGRSLGDMLVEEGLAREWRGRREPWC
jgi:endonuclease YncB( thermonuclease family)